MQEEEHRSLRGMHPFAEGTLSTRSAIGTGRALDRTPLTVRLISTFRSLSQAASATVILLGAIVFAGELIGFPGLRTTLILNLKPNAALCFVLAGFSLWLLRVESTDRPRRRLGHFCAVGVAVLGLLTFSEYFSGQDLGIDRLLLRESVSEASYPGRMGPNTALSFVLTGCALLLLDCETRRRRRPAQLLAIAAALISLVAVNVRIYGVDSRYGIASYAEMTWAGGMGFLLLCAGILFARPDRGLMALVASDTAGGFMVRRLSLAVVLVPLVMGWARLAGQRAGFYSGEFGVVLFVVLGIVVLGLVVWKSAALLDWMDVERRQAEQALLEREERFRALIENSSDAIALVSPDGMIRYASPSTRRVLGYSNEEMVGRNTFDLMHPDDVPSAREKFAELLKTPGSSVTSQYRYLHKNCSWRWVEGFTTNLRSEPAVRAIVNNYRDITERKQAEEASSYLAAIVQSSGDAIIGKTLDGKIVSWNQGAERIYGYTAGEVIDRPISILVPPEQQGEFLRICERLRRGERIEHYETVRVRKDGKQIPVSLTVSPVTNSAGEITGASTIARDVTASKSAEEALKQANTVLTGWLRELEKRTHESSLLADMVDLLQTCVSGEEAYAVVARFAQQLFPTDPGALCVLNNSRSMVEAVALWGGSPAGEPVFTPEGCWALRRGQVHLVEDASTGPVCAHLSASGARGYLCVPMMAQGEALGVFHLQVGAQEAPAGGSWLTEAKQRLAETVAGQIALSLANLRLRETLRLQSIRDPLTGLFNRRYMEESLARELRRAARNQHSLGAIMLDLDHFKRFNDTFGHEAGDALLRELGDFLRTRTRREDIACRYGGEEFAIILPDASIEATLQRAERLRSEFKHLNMQHRGQSLGVVTLSLGVAVFPEHGATVEDILRAADRALYRAKEEGRDRAVVGESSDIVLGEPR